MLRVNAKPADYDGLHALTTPDANRDPRAHPALPRGRSHEKYAGHAGHEVTVEHFGVTEDGMRFFGLLSFKSTS
jgi:hypothetical protein